MNADLTLDFGRLDGLWLIVGLPIVALLVFVLLSPLSFLIYKRLAKRMPGNVAPGASELNP